jgi:Arginine methyltransferase oligomerization subdomain/Ribosomal protein L11 methyltransferase (PrmA)
VSLVVDEHRYYLEDAERIRAFSGAIAEVIKPGDVVVDLASGTGILGLLACRAGAKRVYSIEMGGIISVARDIARANGFEDRVVFVKGYSPHVNLPEKVDVVVADQIGNFGFNGGIIEYYADARSRFLRTQGVTIPLRMSLILGPVEAPDLFRQVEFWNTSPAGFDFSVARELAVNTGYVVNLLPTNLCGDAVVVREIDLNHADTKSFAGRGTAIIHRSGTMHGLGGWFAAELAPGIVMTNSPLSPERIQRRQVFLPINRPVNVAEGDFVKIHVTVQPSASMANWSVDVIGGESRVSKGSFRHSTWKGMLISKEEIERTKPEFKPKLVPRGEARRTVVNLCDGIRTLREIEDEVFRLHPGLFEKREDAAVFVAEVVTRYAE